MSPAELRMRLYELVERGLPQVVADRIWLANATHLLPELEALTGAELRLSAPAAKTRWVDLFGSGEA